MTTHEHRQPTHREDLERTLVGGIACFIGEDPAKAKAIADGIKTLLDGLAPAMPQPASIAALPVIDPGPDSLERGMERAHKIQDEALLAGATGREDMRLLCGAATFTVPIEQEIQAKADKAPRVTPADIEANIIGEHYHSPQQAGDQAWTGDANGALGTLTFCVLVLRNGFTVTGESACASPENFDAEIGRKIARQNAVQKIWPLMGYALKEKMNG